MMLVVEEDNQIAVRNTPPLEEAGLTGKRCNAADSESAPCRRFSFNRRPAARAAPAAMRRPSLKGDATEGREWWAAFAAVGFIIALYLLVGLFRDVTQAKLPPTCNNTAQGAVYVTDDMGFLCRRSQLDPDTSCCLEGDRFSCEGCNSTLQCCAAYEPCVSCCLNPASLPQRMAYVRETSINPILLRSLGSPFGSRSLDAQKSRDSFFFPLDRLLSQRLPDFV